jgi:hypothetical protein
MSALPPKADIGTQSRDVRFVPIADMGQRSELLRYSITSWAQGTNVSLCGRRRAALAYVYY